MRRWRSANPEKVRAQKLRTHYSLDPESAKKLLAAQSGRCAICEEPDPSCIDHCHATGRVRGVLCRKCNSGLGQFRDDPELLVAAIAYLDEARSRA